jgi:3-phenylpropionate/trans-cinnamate dioxygenase ferredoxin component
MTDYRRACALADVPEQGAVRVTVDGEILAVIRDEGELHAISDTCTHEDVSLSEGEIEDGEVECWLHGSRFDLTTGQPTCLPATRPVAVYPVTTQGEDVLVDIDHPLNQEKSA